MKNDALSTTLRCFFRSKVDQSLWGSGHICNNSRGIQIYFRNKFLITPRRRLGLGPRFEHNWRKYEDFHILDWYRDQTLGGLGLKWLGIGEEHSAPRIVAEI
jgi:hypothetical protein